MRDRRGWWIAISVLLFVAAPVRADKREAARAAYCRNISGNTVYGGCCPSTGC